MTWKELLAQGRIAGEPTSKAELEELKLLAQRCLADARLPELSDDGKFDRAYGAARTLATMVVHCEGYRVKPVTGSRLATFLAPKAADSATFSGLCSLLDKCRAKRNRASYEISGIITARPAGASLDGHGRRINAAALTPNTVPDRRSPCS